MSEKNVNNGMNGAKVGSFGCLLLALACIAIVALLLLAGAVDLETSTSVYYGGMVAVMGWVP